MTASKPTAGTPNGTSVARLNSPPAWDRRCDCDLVDITVH
jgi:hypothetical protein